MTDKTIRARVKVAIPALKQLLVSQDYYTSEQIF